MIRLITISAIFFLLIPRVCFAEGYKVDISTMEAIKHFNVLNIGSLAVGETGIVSIYGLKTCIENGELKIASISKLDTEPSKYSYDYEVTRHPNNELSVVFSKKGKNPDSAAVQQAVFEILYSSDCQKINFKGIPLFNVKSFLGSGSLSELLTNTGEIREKGVSETPAIPGSVKVSEAVSHWIVTESRSPIDDSPGVTMLKPAEDGEQMLVIRCRENKTDAYIRTDDFLGNDSTNVTVRFDDEKAKQQHFSLSTNNRALFFSPAIPNIKTMMKSEKVVIRYNTYNGTPKTVTFKLYGLPEKIVSLRKACHW